MGFHLAIGEAYILYDEHWTRIECERVKRADAPDGRLGQSNTCNVPYSFLHDAVAALGLGDVVFSDEIHDTFTFEGRVRYALITSHPGTQAITPDHAAVVEAALVAYRAVHADANPNDNTHSKALAVGEWLAFWLRWAIENCKQPVFVNS